MRPAGRPADGSCSSAGARGILLLVGCGRIPQTAAPTASRPHPRPASAHPRPRRRPPRRRFPLLAKASSSLGPTPTPMRRSVPPGSAGDPGRGRDQPGWNPMRRRRTSCEYVPPARRRERSRPPTTNVPASGEVTAVVGMTEGTVRVVLDRVSAPCTVNSFVSLVRQKFYDKTRCHRLSTRGSSCCSAVTLPERHRRPRLQLRRRDRRQRALQRRGRRHGQRRSQHQRLAVLLRLRALAIGRRTTRCSGGWTMRPGAWWPGWPSRVRTAATLPAAASQTIRPRSCR